jgi:hypothetical protein
MPWARLATWTQRLGNITDEVQSLIHDRDVWRTISEIGASNPAVVANPFVMGHFNTLYYRRALFRYSSSSSSAGVAGAALSARGATPSPRK